ncbi:Progesterone-induced-blocking factor 1 [Phytophthora nicotianae]|uniref:Progesterone-induced-blocking factor 1 n=1 Tax=Phytophthora nicotianae TaxID=4792 RepID=A0A0W8C003_PHYNI|nr:Progesterone-induced-blocking factor 1 [Phytophthora nicotianae]
MADEDRRFRRLAAQLGVSRHVLGPENAADATGTLSTRVERTVHEAADDEHQVDEEIDVEGPHDEDEEEGEEDVGEISLTLPSDSASEGLSSDLSLPHSFGHYDQLSTGRGISRFDDHLTALSPGQLPSGRTNRLQQTLPQVVAMGTNNATSEVVMKQFYEIQVGKIRTQLVLSVQAQKELEKTLQQERAAWQEKEAEMEQKSDEELDRLEKALKQAHADLQAAQTRLRMEKTHFATLQISDALAEQLSRQNEEDLSIREYIQLSIHSKVRKLESELERCRQEVETLQKISSADKAAAAGASDEIVQVQRIAEAKERRLQHELELSEATRQELENQIKALVDQVDGMKEEQRRNEEIYSDQRGLKKESDRLKRDLQVLQSEHDDLKARFDEASATSSDSHQKIALLTADKAFLQDAKTQLEDQVANMRVSQQEMQGKINSLQEKHDDNLSQSAQLQNETRLHFEKKLDDEMAKFMELSKREIERIRNDGQVVYERENRLLKEARDDALKHVEVLQVRLDSVQSALDEKISQLKLTLEEKARDARNARLEIEMLTQKVEALKEEFARLETTSTTRITQLEAALEVERNKLKEYELLEIDLDGAVIQTGEIAAGNQADGSAKVQEVMTTFGAIPTTTKRRVKATFQQSVLLAQKVVKSQRETIALEQKLNEVTSDRTRLQHEVTGLKTKLASFQQPQSYLIDKLTRREEELQRAVRRYQEAQSQLQQLRAQYQHAQDANASLQQQLQQLLTRRGDLDALKATVQLLQGKIQAPNNKHKELRHGNVKVQVAQDHGFTRPSHAAGTVDAAPSSPIAATTGKVSPPPSIASKMTQPPTPQRQKDGLSSVRVASEVSSSLSSISSTPRWYTKLRDTNR